MSPPLRLLIYDNTGHGKPWIQPWLSASWRVGAWLYRRLGRFDAVYPATSVEGVLAWLARGTEGDIAEVQYWGHGMPGYVLVGRERLDAATLAGPAMEDIRGRFGPESLVWLRTCASFSGAPGRSFAVALAARFGCRVAGHTFNIGLLQSGLHSLQPGALPSWSEAEGRMAGRSAAPSTPLAPRTVAFTAQRVPDGW